ncbi:hypothetical protein [Micromonospora sp. NBC_01796]|uniref:hypothetical protein n=1 Tax=Micromonospora sp. NBC_01796 TaxID=2975987 RepID=UPI002DDBC7F5|nr:hypothetical protein [Micromonospora sp. NBC_01796]WSA87314.1 hypothetical protein OIE47_06780 [Micromonospora sp. NBC_01796]
MRVVRTIAGVLLLTVGLTAVLVGSALWTVAGQRDPGGAFTATLQRIQTPGRAIVVPDVDELLRRDAPFARTGQARLRIAAGTESRPAFLGLAPTAEVGRYLATMPYALVDRVAVTRGRLPVQVTSVSGIGVPSQALVAQPGEQAFWVRQGTRTLDLDLDDLRAQRLSLVVMYPDAGPGVALDLRAELRVGWLEPTTWGLLAGGVLFAVLGVAVLVWPSRPREVVFVVEPGQLPVLTARLGVRALDDVGEPVRANKRSRRPVRSRALSPLPTPVAPAAAPVGWPTQSNLPAPSRPVDTTSSRPVDISGSRPVDISGSRPVDISGSRPVDVTSSRPVDVTSARSVDTTSARSVDATSARSANGLRARRTGPASARPETLADVLSPPEGTQAGTTVPPVEVAANGEPAGGTPVSGRSLDHIWPASSPPPAKLVLNWPPRAAGTTAPVSKQPANRAPAYPAKTAPVRSAQFQPTRAEAAQPEAAQPEPAQPAAPQSEAAQPEPAQPAAPQSEAVQSGTAQPGTAQPGTAQPGAVQPGTAQPGTGRAVAVPPVPPVPVEPETNPAGTAPTRPDPAPKSEPALDPVHARAERVTNPVPAYPGKGMAESSAAQASGVPVVGVGPAAKPAAPRATSTRRTKAAGTAESGAVTTRSKKCKPVADAGAQPSAVSTADADTGPAAGGGGPAEAASTR